MWGKPKSRWKAWMPDFVGDEVDPERSTGPWSGHRDFAYDLIRWRPPAVVVELGTHYGVSFFAFCQAVIDARADAELHAVDTWKGDEHAGLYDESVFRQFSRSAESFSSANITLHRSTFREALAEFKDGSVDLLHIDGCHSYEALQDDYESWLPKLAANGVVLMHDVSPDSGYGSARYYAEEVADSAPGFIFPHFFGLGVVFPNGTDGWETLLSDSFAGWKQFYPERAEARLLRAVKRDQTKMIDERSVLLAKYERKIEENAKALERSVLEIESRDAALERSTFEIESRDAALERSTFEIESRDAALRTTSRQLRQARDRAQQLAPLEMSPKAQLKALRHSLPRSLGIRARRYRASFRAARTKRLGRSESDESSHSSSGSGSALKTNVSLDSILSDLLHQGPSSERSDAECRLFAGLPVTPEHATRLSEIESQLTSGSSEPLLGSLLSQSSNKPGEVGALLKDVDFDLLTVDIWDTLILRNRPADAAKTATGRRISLLSANLGEGPRLGPFEIAALRVEIEAGLAVATPSEEYELTEVIEGVLERLGYGAGSDRIELAQRLATEEAQDEIRWSDPNPELVELIREAAQPVALLSDFYMRTDLLATIVSQVTGLDARLLVSVDMNLSKRLDGGMFDAVRAKYQVDPARHLHIGDNPHSDVEQQISGGGLALEVQRPDRFPAPGQFRREDLRECWAELDRQIDEGLPETTDRYRTAGRALAPMAVGMVVLAVEQAIGSGVDRVHYLSREGAFLREVHQLAEPILRPARHLEVSGIHLEASRLSTFAASLESPVRNSLHRMWSMYAKQSVAAMLTSIGIAPEDVAEHLRRVGLTAETHLSNAATDPRVQELFDSPDFDLFVSKHVERSRTLLRDYVSERTELTDPFVVVDIGWRGTIQDNLVRALDVERSVGVYFGLFPFLNAQVPGSKKVALAFDGNRGEEFAFAEPPAVLERPWTADIASTIGYRRAGGTVMPVRAKESGAVSTGIESFQQGTLEAASIAADWIVGMGLASELLRPGLAERARKLWADPPRGVADIWFESDHDDSFGALNQVAFHKLGPDQSWLQGQLRRHVRQGEKLSGWPAGYRAWSPVRSIIELALLWGEKDGGS